MRTAKRFYIDVGVEEGPEGFRVTLDGRAVKTPAGGLLVLPGRPLAEAVAAEWAAQDQKIQPHTMPLFRLCATALDRVRPDRQAVIAGVVSYAPTELVCYRAVEPRELVERQEAVWQPLLDWAEEMFGVKFRVTRGVMPVEPVPGLQDGLAGPIARLDDFTLAGLATADGVLRVDDRRSGAGVRARRSRGGLRGGDAGRTPSGGEMGRGRGSRRAAEAVAQTARGGCCLHRARRVPCIEEPCRH